jgi:hypothetical protein
MAINPQANRAMRRFGQDLQRLRKAMQPALTQQEVGVKLGGRNNDVVSRFERGTQWPTLKQLNKMLDIYGAGAETRAALIATMQSTQQATEVWWDQYKDCITTNLRRMVELEDVAKKITSFGGIPGLLQTEEYIWAALRFGVQEFGEPVTRRRAELRQRRSGVLTRERPVVLDALIVEGALRERVGGCPVMRGQLEHLATMGRRSNVSIRVLPKEAPVGGVIFPPFSIFDFFSDPSMFTFDAANSSVFEEDPKENRYMRRQFDFLLAHALSPVESVELIETIIKEM